MFNFPEKKWCYREANESLCESLANELHLPKPIVSLLLQRGLKSSEEIDNFLNPTLAQLPSPSLMKGMNQAVNLLYETLVSRSPVIIYGDYDVDGATGTALLALFFKLVGFKVIYYQPNRLADGYGLHKTSIEKLFEQVRGYSHPLLVTVDCGISALDEVAYAKDLGLKVVITDHHKPPVELPVADAILNPLQPKCKFPFLLGISNNSPISQHI